MRKFREADDLKKWREYLEVGYKTLYAELVSEYKEIHPTHWEETGESLGPVSTTTIKDDKRRGKYGSNRRPSAETIRSWTTLLVFCASCRCSRTATRATASGNVTADRFTTNHGGGALGVSRWVTPWEISTMVM